MRLPKTEVEFIKAWGFVPSSVKENRFIDPEGVPGEKSSNFKVTREVT